MAFDKIIFSLYVTNFFINAAISLLAPFYPSVAQKKGVEQDIIGVIFSASPLGSIFSGIICGMMMQIWGRKNLICFGLTCQTLTIITFGAVEIIDDYTTFVTVSIISRFIQGIGMSSYLTTSYAYLPLLYADKVEEKIAMMEIFTGLGLLVGPLVGSLLYNIGGYQIPFYFMSSFFLIVTPVILHFLPSDQEIEQNKKNIYKKQKQKVNYLKIFTNKRMFFTYFLISLPSMGIAFISPTLADHLQSFNISHQLTGVLFIIGALFYALSLPLVSKVPKDVDKRISLIIGAISIGVAFLMLGPEKYIFPNQLYIVMIGYAILGFGAAFTMVPSISELINVGEVIYPNNKEDIGDIASGLFNSAYSFGMVTGPLFGGLLTKHQGFAYGCSFFGYSQFIYLAFYLLFGEGKHAFLNEKSIKNEYKQPLYDIDNDSIRVELTSKEKNNFRDSISTNASEEL